MTSRKSTTTTTAYDFSIYRNIILTLEKDYITPMVFGKYKNKLNWGDIYQNDKKYCRWVLKQTSRDLQFLLFKQFLERMCFICQVPVYAYPDTR